MPEPTTTLTALLAKQQAVIDAQKKASEELKKAQAEASQGQTATPAPKA